MSAPPLGQLESDTLEFKAAAAVGNLFDIGREVVAFLNAGKPAELWIGLAEGADGRAVGIEVVDVSRVAALENHLHDTIYPRPADDLHVDRVAVDGGEILLLRIRPAANGPHAQLKQSGWYFYVRVGARVRPMEFHEIALQFRRHGRKDDDAIAVASQTLSAERAAKLAKARSHLWVGLLPVWTGERKLGEDRIHLDRKEFDRWLREPVTTGNRDSGWTFANPYLDPVRAGGRKVLAGGSTSIELDASGLLSFTATLDRLVWSSVPKLIANAPLCEFPTSVMRLLAKMLVTPQVCPVMPRFVLADIALSGAKDWRLSRYDPLRNVFWDGFEKTCTDDADLTWPEPLQFDVEEVRDAPDRCAMRLVTRVYQAFGFRDEELPDLFDRTTGRLVLP